jgi:hypothetical protein
MLVLGEYFSTHMICMCIIFYAVQLQLIHMFD